MRREIDRLSDSFDGGFWRSPFRRSAFDIEPLWQRELTWRSIPAVDILEKDKAYEIDKQTSILGGHANIAVAARQQILDPPLFVVM